MNFASKNVQLVLESMPFTFFSASWDDLFHHIHFHIYFIYWKFRFNKICSAEFEIRIVEPSEKKSKTKTRKLSKIYNTGWEFMLNCVKTIANNFFLTQPKIFSRNIGMLSFRFCKFEFSFSSTFQFIFIELNFSVYRHAHHQSESFGKFVHFQMDIRVYFMAFEWCVYCIS